jgi:GTP-binding protein
MFVDRVQIELIAGRGGDGCCSFRREKYIPDGGPDGGDGGDGGSVIICARAGVDSLNALAHKKFWHATSGTNGSGSQRSGRGGEDSIIEVPPGTIIFEAETGLILKDLTKDGETVVAARGGRGGKGNLRFKTSINRAPTETTSGEEGEHKLVLLELKVIADVGLLGKPNAGKSTLLSRLSRARPQIADYPFTTKHPNLGIVRIDGDRQFVMADIPGLIEGAHEGVGLGIEFLRHIERAGILVHLVEPMPFDGIDPVENYKAIRHEVESYSESVGARPEILCVSKAELPTAAEVRDRLQAELGRDVLLISAVTGQGLSDLMHRIAKELDAAKSTAAV